MPKRKRETDDETNYVPVYSVHYHWVRTRKLGEWWVHGGWLLLLRSWGIYGSRPCRMRWNSHDHMPRSVQHSTADRDCGREGPVKKICLIVIFASVLSACGSQSAGTRPASCDQAQWQFTNEGVRVAVEAATEFTMGKDVDQIFCAATRAEALQILDDASAKLRAKDPTPGYAEWAIATYLKPERDRIVAAGP
jgi:hypothetical protein